MNYVQALPPLPEPAPKPTQSAASAPAPKRVPAYMQTVELRLPKRKFNRAQQRIVQMAIASLVVVALAVGAMLTLTSPKPTPKPTVKVTPVVSAVDAFSYFRKVGILVSNFQEISAPNTTWAAKEEIRFDVTEGETKGSILILTYDSPTQAGIDAPNAAEQESLKDWKIVQVAKFVIVSFPGTPQTITDAIVKGLEEYLTQLGVSVLAPSAALI